MDDLELYEWWAAEAVSYANATPPAVTDWRDAYEEMASELVSLANLVLREAV